MMVVFMTSILEGFQFCREKEGGLNDRSGFVCPDRPKHR